MDSRVNHTIKILFQVFITRVSGMRRKPRFSWLSSGASSFDNELFLRASGGLLHGGLCLLPGADLFF